MISRIIIFVFITIGPFVSSLIHPEINQCRLFSDNRKGNLNGYNNVIEIPSHLTSNGKNLTFGLKKGNEKLCQISSIALSLSIVGNKSQQVNTSSSIIVDPVKNNFSSINPLPETIIDPLINTTAETNDVGDSSSFNETLYNFIIVSNDITDSSKLLNSSVAKRDSVANESGSVSSSTPPKQKPEKTFLTNAKKLRGKNGTRFTPNGYLEYNDEYYRPNDYCISGISDTQIQVKVCPVMCDGKDTLCVPKCCGVGEVLIYWNFTCRPIAEDESDAKVWSPYLYKWAHERVGESEENKLNIHYIRSFLSCPNSPRTKNKTQAWNTFPFNATVIRPKNVALNPHSGYMRKMLKSGEIIYLDYSRRWKSVDLVKGDYCIDGYANWGKGGNGSYLGDEAHQVILSCPREMTNNDAEPWLADLYAGFLYGSSIFLFLTAAIHIILYDHQNIHGLTIMSQAISLFFMYITHATAFYVSQRRKPEKDVKCIIIGILAHLFFLTTFSWLSVVNFDLWLTFRSMRPVSKISKKMRRFRLYSLIGWGVPIMLIMIFVLLDYFFPEPESEVIVPDYGTRSCFVASHARSYYVCTILAIVIPINLVMILGTFKIFYDFRNGKGAWTSKAAKSDRYSFKLFIKLFIVMGAIWTIELVNCWFYQGEQAPVFLILLDLAMPFQAISFFLIFCWNRRTLNQLEEKFPCFKPFFEPVRKVFGIGRSVDETGTNDTSPNINTGGLRKGSLTSTISLSGTMDRKMSKNSVVSIRENVELESMQTFLSLE